MKGELEEIVKSLMKFCKKYGKDYVDMCVINNHGMANLSPDDKDYKNLRVYIDEKESL